MAQRSRSWLTIVALGAALAACSGSDSGAPGTSAPDATEVIADTTVPVTEVDTTEPTTTLPAELNLADLPGLLAVEAYSCAPEPYPEVTDIPDTVVCTLRPDGSDARQLSAGSGGGPRFLRDGVHLLYSDPVSRYGTLVDLDTGESRLRVANEPLRSGVSPDGTMIIFNDPTQGGISIATVDGTPLPDGSTTRLVVADPFGYSASGPSWAPDSIRYAYLSTSDGAGGELECPEVWVGGVDGRAPVQLTHFADAPDGAEGCPESVRWSPVDDTILLRMLGKPMYTAENLYTIQADGSGLTALTHSEPLTDMNASTYGVEGNSYSGDWSPDGKYIACIMGNGTGYDLWVMTADGGQMTKVESAPLGITTSLVAIRWALG